MRHEPLTPLPRLLLVTALLLGACLLPAIPLAQEGTGYLPGEFQGLEFLVHIMGEVQRPGEYLVSDQTDLLELLSKAGGPTPYSLLGAVSVRRVSPSRPLGATTGVSPPTVEIIVVDLDKVLRDPAAAPPPMLRPGDVVFVHKNFSHKMKTISAILRDVSIAFSAYYFYTRATRP